MRHRSVVWLLLVVGIAGLGFYFFRQWPAALPTLKITRRLATGPTPAPAALAMAAAAPVAAPNPARRAEKNPRPDSVIASAWLSETQPAMAAFTEWTARYLNAPAAQQAGLLPEGLALARQRRAALAALIPTDPEQALADAVPMVVRQQLPPEILALLEERVSAQGDLELLAGSPAPGQTTPIPSYRSTLINGREYRVYEYGRRATLATLPKTSIIGIAVDQALAVSDSPVRILEAGELAGSRPVTNVCAVSGNITPIDASAGFNAAIPTAIEAGGQIQVLCCETHLNLYEQQLIAAEQANFEVLAADGAPGSSDVTGRPSSAWTHGTKKVLIIVVDFSDLPGTPKNPYDPDPATNPTNATNISITTDYIANRYNAANQVGDFFNQASYGLTALQVGAVVSGASPDITPVLRMPSTAASYATVGANDLLHSDAETLAHNAGYNLAAYDRIGVVFSDLSHISNSQITYGGLGEIIGTNFWINGAFNLKQVAHEMGHTFGLNHANFWSVTDGNPVSPNGASVEYGDPFDVMGTGITAAAQFSQWNRSILQWLPDAAVTTITTTGTYRVYTFDNPAANPANPLALKVVRDNTRDYWIGYRTNSGNATLNDGAYVVWGYDTNQQGNLLNLKTPGSSGISPGLEVGHTFTDTAAGITLQTLDQGGSGVGSYLDLVVTFQPRIQWSQSTYYVDEQLGQATLTLVRQDNGVGALSVHYATADGNATTPGFYTAQSGTVNWAAGDQSNKIITVPIVAGAFAGGIKKFTVALDSPSGAVIANNATATVNLGSPGAVDPSFAVDNIGSDLNRVIVQPDGKIIVAGPFTFVQEPSPSFALSSQGGIARLNADGTLDTAFDSHTGVSGGSNHDVYDAVRQADGKIILGGDFTSVNGTPANRLARLNTDGTLDATFHYGTGADDLVYAVLAQPDGKIVIGGAFLHYNGTASQYVARLNVDGTLDATFTGPVFSGGASGWRVTSLALQPDGKLLVGGEFYFTGGANFKSGLCRLNANGSLDAAFTGVAQGAATNGNSSQLLPVNRIAVQLDGNIVIAGDFTAYNNVAHSGLARVTSTGALDATFTATTDGNCSALLVQPDGKILVGGTFAHVNGAAANNLARLTGTGATDPVSLSVTPLGNFTKIGDFALQPDGRIVFGGFGTFQSTTSGELWRFFSGLSGLPGTVQWSVASANGTPGNTLLLTATRTGGSAGNLSVNYATDAASAAASLVTPATGTLSWANGDSAAKTASISIGGSANGTLAVNLGSPLLGGALLDANQQALVAIAQLTFATWQSEFFTPSQLQNPLISGGSGDPNANGVANSLEYAFGLNPLARTNTGPAGLSVVSIQNIGGTNYLTITFRERTPPGDLTYTPQASATADFASPTTPVLVSTTPNNDGTQTVVYRDSVPFSAANPLRFMRVLVAVAAP